MAIGADFYGPKYTPIVAPESNVITVEEYHAVMERFPRAGFDYNGFKGVMCDICREKPATTYDNFVGESARKWGPNGVGLGKEKLDAAMSDAVFASESERSISYLVELDRSMASA